MADFEPSRRGQDERAKARKRRDGAEHFDTSHLDKDLRGHSVRGGALTIIAQTSRHGLKILSMVVLARLLTPGDFGLVAMLAAITGFLTAFRELGLSVATVQQERVSHGQVSTLFWINFLLGVLVAAMVAALGPVIVWFFDDARLLEMTWVVAGAFIITGAAAQHRALLQRRMRFKALTVIRITSETLANGTAIVMGLLGAGYWSLLAIPVGSMVFGAVGAWLATGWIPGPPVRGSGVRKMISFGAFLSGSRMLNHFSRNVDFILIGWRAGAGPLGFYRNAYQLLVLPLRELNAPLTQVAVPAMSRLQSQPQRFVRFYKQAVTPLVALGLPVVAFSILAAHDLMRVALGPGWDRAASIFQLLGPGAFIQVLALSTTWVFISLARTGRQFRWMVVESLILTIAFALGVLWNAEGVAIAYSAATLAMFPAKVLYCYHGTPLRMSDLLEVAWRPVLGSLVAGLPAAALLALLPDLTPTIRPILGLMRAWLWDFNLNGEIISSFIRLALAASAYGLIYTGLWAALPGGAAQIKSMLAVRKDLLAARSRPRHAAKSVKPVQAV